MLEKFCGACMNLFGNEAMTDMSGSKESYKEVVVTLFAFVLSLLIVAFVGKWLWNNSVAELFTIVRPVRSIWQLIAFVLLLAIIR